MVVSYTGQTENVLLTWEDLQTTDGMMYAIKESH